MEPILRVEHLVREYGGRGSVTRAIDDVSFSVDQGEFVGIMGASGSGKSTLLNCVSTIDSPTAGKIWVEGKEVTRMKPKQGLPVPSERLGFVFQDCNLLDTLTAFENIALALTIRGTAPGPGGEKGEGDSGIAGNCRLHEQIPLSNVRRPAPADGCCPGYCHQPCPGAGRRAYRRPGLQVCKLLLDRFEALNSQREATILMVTHDAFTASYCHRILFLQDGAVLTQLERGGQSRREFFRQIIDVVTRLGGDQSDVL